MVTDSFESAMSTVVRPVRPRLVRRVCAVVPTRVERVPLLPDFLADLARVARTVIGPDPHRPDPHLPTDPEDAS